jgi:hypothetical protein
MLKLWDGSAHAAPEKLPATPRSGFPQGKPLPIINVLVITRCVTEVRVLRLYSA